MSVEVVSLGHSAQPQHLQRVRSRKQLRSEDDGHPVERVEHERGEPVSVPVSSCHCSYFVAVPGIMKGAEGKYQVIDEGDLRDGPEESGIFHFWKF